MMEDVPTAADAAPVQAVDDAQMTLNSGLNSTLLRRSWAMVRSR
jgi:hypothetical protein